MAETRTASEPRKQTNDIEGNQMAWRPTDWVIGGEIDNTIKGWTTGWIDLQGRHEPLQLKLAGNCHPGLAGWKLRITRIDPIPDWAEPLNFEGIATDQSGNVGDVTEQELKHIECSPKEFVRRRYAGEHVETTPRTGIYLEWFSNRNGRVVIQCTRLAFERIGHQAFELTDEEFALQARHNDDELQHFMLQVGDALDQAPDKDELEGDSGD